MVVVVVVVVGAVVVVVVAVDVPFILSAVVRAHSLLPLPVGVVTFIELSKGRV